MRKLLDICIFWRRIKLHYWIEYFLVKRFFDGSFKINGKKFFNGGKRTNPESCICKFWKIWVNARIGTHTKFFRNLLSYSAKEIFGIFEISAKARISAAALWCFPSTVFPKWLNNEVVQNIKKNIGTVFCGEARTEDSKHNIRRKFALSKLILSGTFWTISTQNNWKFEVFRTVSKNLSAGVAKLHSTFPEEHFWKQFGKILILFFIGFLSKIFRQSCQNLMLRVQRNKWRLRKREHVHSKLVNHANTGSTCW